MADQQFPASFGIDIDESGCHPRPGVSRPEKFCAALEKSGVVFVPASVYNETDSVCFIKRERNKPLTILKEDAHEDTD